MSCPVSTEAENAYKELLNWSAHEHLLVNARIGWLISSSGFLFAALALSYTQKEDDTLQTVIPLVGVIFSFVSMILIFFAILAVNNIGKRVRYILENSDNSALRLLNPDYNFEIEEDGEFKVVVKRRLALTDCIAKFLTFILSAVIFLLWLYVFIKSI